MASAVTLGRQTFGRDVSRQLEEPDADADRLLSKAADARAVQDCLSGNTPAFDGLVERHQRWVYQLCYRYVGNHHDANDLAQETFLKAYRALARFRGDSSFATWVHRIAVNTCLNHRAAYRRTEELRESVAAPGDGHAKRLEDEETRRRVRSAVDRLPEKQRRTLMLKIYGEMTHEQVAASLGSSVGTVKANLFHAVANLKKILVTGGTRR